MRALPETRLRLGLNEQQKHEIKRPSVIGPSCESPLASPPTELASQDLGHES